MIFYTVSQSTVHERKGSAQCKSVLHCNEEAIAIERLVQVGSVNNNFSLSNYNMY